MEVLAVALTILSFATSPIVTNALDIGKKIPSFIYYHTPLLFVALCQPDKFLSLLIFSSFMLIYTIGAAFYVWYRDMW